MSKTKNENSEPRLHVCPHELGELLVQHVKEQTDDAFELEGIEWRPVDEDGDPILFPTDAFEKSQVEFLLHLRPKVVN